MSAQRELRIAEKMGRCIHFTGRFAPGMVRIDACKAGVSYDAVQVDHDAVPYVSRSGGNYTATRSLPCVDSLNHCAALCAKREAVSRDKAEAECDESDATVARLLKARAAIVTDGKSSGETTCPNCATGRVRYAKASNGHIHAKCSTEGCCAWME